MKIIASLKNKISCYALIVLLIIYLTSIHHSSRNKLLLLSLNVNRRFNTPKLIETFRPWLDYLKHLFELGTRDIETLNHVIKWGHVVEIFLLKDSREPNSSKTSRIQDYKISIWKVWMNGISDEICQLALTIIESLKINLILDQLNKIFFHLRKPLFLVDCLHSLIRDDIMIMESPIHKLSCIFKGFIAHELTSTSVLEYFLTNRNWSLNFLFYDMLVRVKG